MGHGAYEVMKRAPWLFSAGALFSAADDALITDQNLESIIAGIPLWIFQGGIDKKPTPKQTERYVKQLREAGANVRYTLYEQLGHGTWNKAFAEPDFFSWMLRQRNNDIHVFANNPAICATSGDGSRLSLPEGYAEYQWELNGQIVEGQTSYRFIAKTPGAYRARTRSTNNEWSEWSAIINVIQKMPAQPVIEQFGTVLLKDPNNNNDAVLISKENFAHYYWYKNGTLLNLPGSQDDTLQQVNVKSAFGDGAYTLRIADFDNCISPPSLEKHIFFSDRAPLNIAAPDGHTFSNLNASSVSISWQDRSDNENGFEVWRKKLSGPDTLWKMVIITEQNVVSYNDTGLLPASEYSYIVRAVSNSGRSEYTSPHLVRTPTDTEPPSSPSGLTAELKGVKKILLTWNPSNDNSRVKEYWIIIGNETIKTASPDTSFVISEFSINTNYNLLVKAVDIGENVSEPSNNVDIYTKFSGLFYEHSTGDWNSIGEIDWSIAEYTGTVNEFTLAPKTQEDFFNFRFDGYLNIEEEGTYQFRLSSNDGSRLVLDDSLLILNDGIHNLATVTAPIQLLSAGPHRITVDFFDSILSDSLLVEYKGPDTNNEWISIPAVRLSSDIVTSIENPTVSLDPDFDVYPNPVKNGTINLKLPDEVTGTLSVSIVSPTGHRIRQMTLPSNPASEIAIIDLDELPNGFYFIEVLLDHKRITRKIIIDR
jgi:hypothetical protein